MIKIMLTFFKKSPTRKNLHPEYFSEIVFRCSIGHDVHNGHELPEADGPVPVLVVHVEHPLGQFVAVFAGETLTEKGPRVNITNFVKIYKPVCTLEQTCPTSCKSAFFCKVGAPKLFESLEIKTSLVQV